MQRSKIKVGSDYAVSNYRDWWQHPIRGAQVIDVGFWHHLSHWDKEGAAAPPDTVPEPHRPSIEVIEVPGTIRRGDGRFSRDRHTVLVREFSEKDGKRTYSKPYTAATRDLVAPLAEAQQRREEYRTRTQAEAAVAREKREQRAAEEEQFNTRLAAFGAGPVGRNYYSGDRYVLDAATLSMLLTLAERSVVTEPKGEQPEDFPDWS
jgi:hypothetical protein